MNNVMTVMAEEIAEGQWRYVVTANGRVITEGRLDQKNEESVALTRQGELLFWTDASKNQVLNPEWLRDKRKPRYWPASNAIVTPKIPQHWVSSLLFAIREELWGYTQRAYQAIARSKQ